VGSNPTGGMNVSCECYVFSGRGLCDELFTRPEESYRLWCVVECDLEASGMRRPWPTGGLSRQKQIYIYIYIYIYICTEVCLRIEGFASGLINLSVGNRVALSAGIQYNLSIVCHKTSK